MNELLKTNNFLMSHLRHDPLLVLAQTVAFFDPLGMWEEDFEENTIFPDDIDGSLEIALRIMRNNLPDIYFEALAALRQGADYMHINQIICDQMEARGLPIDSIEFMGFGIPLPAYGAEPESTDFYDAHPDMLPIMELFGVVLGDGYYTEIPSKAYTAGQILYLKLRDHANLDYQKIGYLVGWLTNSTQNTLVDIDIETLCSYQPLDWSPDEFEFAVGLLEEADEIMTDAMGGIDILQNNPCLMRALGKNIKRIYRAIEKGKINDSTDLRQIKLRLEWPDTGASVTGAAVAGT
jgi:hypothetical protein